MNSKLESEKAGSCQINSQQFVFGGPEGTNINSIQFNQVAEVAKIAVVAFTNDWNRNRCFLNIVDTIEEKE